MLKPRLESRSVKTEGYLFGLKAEQLVADYLTQRGFNILHNRWKNPYGEIDLIAARADLLIFVEVKARKVFFESEVVSPRQQKRSVEAALYFLSQNEIFANHNIRFDCVLISRTWQLRYIENAWNAEL